MPLELEAVVVGLEASIQRAMNIAGKNAKIDLGASSKAIDSLSQPLGRITGQADQFGKSMEAANARVLAFGASVGILGAVTQGFKEMISTTIQVEKSLANINSVLGANAAQLNKFKNDIFSVAKETGNSFQTVSDAALELSRQGLKSDEVLRRLKDSMVLSRLSGMDATNAVEGLTAAVNSFSKSGITTTEVLNKIAKTASAYSVSEKDLIEGFKRSASVAQQAGVSLDELGGIITAVQEKTARGGAVIGNAFKTIFTRIQRPESLAALQEVGAAVTDMQGGILPATKLIENLAQKMNSLNDIQKANITEKIGGGFQIGPLLASLDDLTSKTSTYKGATQAMANAGNEAYARNAALNKTLAASINEATVNLQELANTLGEIGVTDSLKNVLSFFNSLTSDIKDVLQGEGIGSDFAQSMIKGISAVIGGPGLMIFGAIIAKLTYGLVTFGTESLKAFFGMGQAQKEINALASSLTNTLMTNENIHKAVLSLEGNHVAQATLLGNILKQNNAEMQRFVEMGKRLAPGAAAVFKAGGGSIRTSAQGYIPAVAQEHSDIQRGVGGASPSDKPVIIPNFRFGGGKVGTMVANDGEYVVSNYGGSGGSAIFNRDMVSRIGLPSGAQKINSAGGFIPNFVDYSTYNNSRLDSKVNGIKFQEKLANGKLNPNEQAIYNEYKGRQGNLSNNSISKNIPYLNEKGKLFGMIVNEKISSGTEENVYISSSGKDKVSATLNEIPGKTVAKVNVPVFGIDKQRINSKTHDKLVEKLTQQFTNQAISLALDMGGNELPLGKISQTLNKGSAASAAGSIFESGISALLTSDDFKDFQQRASNSPIDFKSGQIARMKADPNIFNIPSNMATIGLEAKGSKSMYPDVAEKIFKAMGGDVLSRSNNSEDINKRAFINRKSTPEQMAENMAAAGYIPNFANTNYVYDGDRLSPELRASILPAILASGKRKDGILAPSGAGKSTMAAGIGPFIQSLEEVKLANAFTILSGAGLAKTPNGISKPFQTILDSIKSSGGSLKYLNVADKEILARRAGRTTSEGDLRSQKQLDGTNYAKLNQPDFLDAVRKQMGGNLQIINGAKGYIPNFASQNAMDAMERVASYEGSDPRLLAEKRVAISKLKQLKGGSGSKLLKKQEFLNVFNSQLDTIGKGYINDNSIDKLNRELNNGYLGGALDIDNAKLRSRISAFTAAGGYIPNFADPLKEAISREVGAGLNPSQVYVDQNNALKNPNNPMGLMVANRRDEPSGGWQGIDRARKEGSDITSYGAAGGFVPNYAAKPLSSFGGSDESLTTSKEIVTAQKDYLGTIFAVQAGLTLLSGATSDATSGLGKFVNIVTSGLSNVSAAGFAYQGFSEIAKKSTSGLGQFVGKLGTYGAIAAGAFEVFKMGQELYNEYSGANKRAADASNLLAKAAENASFRLDEYSPSAKKDIEDKADAYIKNLKAGKIDIYTGQYIDNPTNSQKTANRVTVDDVNSPILKKGLMGAYGSGKEFDDITKVIISNKLKGQTTQSLNGDVSQDLDISNLSSSLAKLAKNSQAEQLKLNFELFQKGNTGPLIEQGGMKLNKMESYESMSEGQKEGLIRATAKQSGAGYAPTKKLFEEYEKFSKERKKTEDTYIATSSTAYENLKKNLIAEEAYKKRISFIDNTSNNSQIQLQEKITRIMNDQTLSQEDKTEAIKKAEFYNKVSLSSLDLQKQKLTDIQSLVDDISKTDMFKNEMAAKPESAMKLKSSFADQTQNLSPQAMGDLISQADLSGLRDIASKGFKDAGMREDQATITAIVPMIRKTLEDRIKITETTERQIQLDKSLITQEQKRIENANVLRQAFERVKSTLDVQSANKSLENISLRGQADRVDAERRITMANPNTFKGMTNPQDILAKTQQIEEKAFKDRAAYEDKIAKNQAAMDFKKSILTQDNIAALNTNSKAIETLRDAFEKSIAQTYQQSPLDNVSKNFISASTGSNEQLLKNAIKDKNLVSSFSNPQQNKTYLGSEQATPENVYAFLSRIIQKESSGNSNLTFKESFNDKKGPVMSTGLFQVSSESQQGYTGIARTTQDLKNPAVNIDSATTIMKRLLENSDGQIGQGGMARYWSTTGKAAANPSNIDLSQKASTLTVGASKQAELASALTPEQAKASIEKYVASLKVSDDKSQGMIDQITDYTNTLRSLSLQGEEGLKTFKKGQEAQRAEARVRTFGDGFSKGMGGLNNQTDAFASEIGERIPQMFSDNMANAMEEVITKGGDLRDVLKGVAASFLGEINRAIMGNLAKSFTGALFGGGGGIGSYADGGRITGGSGTKDDVPAMLMGGEYVINKNSVSKYGAGFMEQLNNGTLSHFASGGKVKEKSENYQIRSGGLGSDLSSSYTAKASGLSSLPQQGGDGGFYMPGYFGAGSISGKENLRAYAGQAYTSGSNDLISGGGGESGYGAINLEGESLRLTTFGRTRGPMAEAIRASKGEAIDLYYQQLKREEEIEAAHKERIKAFRKQIKTTLITTAASVATGAALGFVAKGFNAGLQGAAPGAGFAGRMSAGFNGIVNGGSVGGGVNVGGVRNLLSGNYELAGMGSSAELGAYLQNNPTSAFTKQFQLNNPMSFDNGNYIPRATIVRATGGPIPQTSGVDTVPAMLSGGEFIMNPAATQKIGSANLNAMNSGVDQPAGDSKELNDKLIAKLDELIKASKEGGKGVTVNVTSDGKEEETKDEGGSEKDKNLSRKIKAAVVAVLQEEKRLGGVLRRN